MGVAADSRFGISPQVQQEDPMWLNCLATIPLTLTNEMATKVKSDAKVLKGQEDE